MVQGSLMPRLPSFSGHSGWFTHGPGAYEIIGVPSSPVPAVRVVGHVPRIHWPNPEKAFAEEVRWIAQSTDSFISLPFIALFFQAALRDEPLIFRNTIADTWAARTQWTWDYLRTKLPGTLQGVKTTPRQPKVTPFFYNHASPFSEVPALSGAYKARAYTRVNMSREEFFDRLNDT